MYNIINFNVRINKFVFIFNVFIGNKINTGIRLIGFDPLIYILD